MKRVLVVDDEPAIAHLLRASLKAAGLPCDVEYCSDGHEGRLKAAQEHYDLITLDRNMPRLGGLEALKAIREDPRSADTPVVVITAEADRSFESRALELGASAVLAKPFGPQQLASTLQPILRRERTESQAAQDSGAGPPGPV